jgi:uncharacterized protein (TIGR03083 family)
MSKEAFTQAATFFVESVAKIGPSQWDDSALGVWSVRDLVGHTSRSISRVAEFAVQPADKIDVASAAQHYHVSLAPDDIDETIAQGGRDAALTLGDDPAATVRASLDAVVLVLTGVSEGTTIAYTNGGIRLEHYLQTRVLELVIHTLDLLAAINDNTQPPREALLSTLHLIADLAADSGFGGQFALLATGRGIIPDRFSVLG